MKYVVARKDVNSNIHSFYSGIFPLAKIHVHGYSILNEKQLRNKIAYFLYRK